ncbi:hypothetical protein F2P81_016241 [Scophthalmus maximus]|uniref:Tubulin polyglutamylase TTLL11 n=1 Tax=Scophthalmus maximus TaxID=52904 RepID=A0A6A4S8Z7_SCOMX|nr:hypothetical protein F2P81_016241 [Scophthalmus maximus]
MEAETQERSPEDGALPSLCLKQVYPKYTKQFNSLRLMERVASLFIRFLGVKGNMRLGPTAFRTFIRTCKLSNSNFTMASVDILYIDITRRWSGTVPDSREAGMGLQAFVEAFFFMAGRRFKSLLLREQVGSLLELCEAQLESQMAVDDRRSVSCSRALPRSVSGGHIYRAPVIAARVKKRHTVKEPDSLSDGCQQQPLAIPDRIRLCVLDLSCKTVRKGFFKASWIFGSVSDEATGADHCSERSPPPGL